MKIKHLAISIFICFALAASHKTSYCQENDSTTVRKVNPTGALFRSIAIPGWGQFYNHKYIKAGAFMLGESYMIYGIATNWKYMNRHKKNFLTTTDPVYKNVEFNKFTDFRDKRNIRIWFLAITIFYSMFDAYVDAQLSDFDQKDKAFEAMVAPMSNDGVALTLNIRIP